MYKFTISVDLLLESQYLIIIETVKCSTSRLKEHTVEKTDNNEKIHYALSRGDFDQETLFSIFL